MSFPLALDLRLVTTLPRRPRRADRLFGRTGRGRRVGRRPGGGRRTRAARHNDPVTVELIPAAGPSPADLSDLGDLLLDAVADGASIGFLDGFTHEQACRWWRGVLQSPDDLTWVARDQGRVVGTVRLLRATMPNGVHRGEVSKFLVHRDVRGRGFGRALMDALETAAVADGRWLLLLDTQTSSHAEGVYERWGWQRIGVVPDHAATPDGVLEPTTFFMKRLVGGPS